MVHAVLTLLTFASEKPLISINFCVERGAGRAGGGQAVGTLDTRAKLGAGGGRGRAMAVARSVPMLVRVAAVATDPAGRLGELLDGVDAGFLELLDI